MKRSLRHPISGDRRYGRPATRSTLRAQRRRPTRQPRIRPRKGVNVASFVASPEEQPYRPALRLKVVGAVVLVLFGLMVLRLWSLQVIQKSHYAEAVTRNQVRTVSLAAPRGLIVDRNDTVMAGNQVTEQIVLSRVEAAEHPAVVGEVAALVGQTPKAVETDLKSVQYSPYEPVPVMTNAPTATIQFLEEHQSEYPGVSVEQVSQRTYPQGTATSTPATGILGYVGDITGAELAAHKGQGYSQTSQIGKTGLEEQYEQYLRGAPGTEALSVNAQGNVVGVLHQTRATQGDTVVTNIDVGLQEVAENALQSVITTDRKTPDAVDNNALPAAPSGAAVVLDPQNGQVLALASYPTYNLNEWVGGISEANYSALTNSCQDAKNPSCPLNDYAIQGLYTPGSTFKLITATASLDDGILASDQYVDDTGTYVVPGCTGSDCSFADDQHDAHGEVDLPTALTVSDDYYFYSLGYLFWVDQNRNGLGDQGIQHIGQDYGLDDYTGIDLPNENVGRIDSPTVEARLHAQDPKDYPNVPNWNIGDNIEMAFGQGGTVITPLQMANAYATFANGGTRYQPEVANSIVSPDGKVLKTFAPRVEGHVPLPASTTQPILSGLEGVLSNQDGTAYPTFEGTSPPFDLQGFTLAGKTGTATQPNGEEPTAWFIAFGPEPNPQYVVLVVVDEGGYGVSAAAPAVKAIYQYLQTNPVKGVTLPTATDQPSSTPPAANPPAGATTTTTSTVPGATPGAPG